MLTLSIIGAVLGVVVAFVLWRWTSVARGARERDQRILPLLDPIAGLIEHGQPVAYDAVEAVASRPYTRPLLYSMLRHYKRTDLFPAKYLGRESHAEGMLMYWMAHPNELQDYPEAMELVETVSHRWSGGSADFLVYKYLMPQGHWARENGWLLGVVGPYTQGDPYSSSASAFSRCSDKADTVKSSDLVAWYASLLERRQPEAEDNQGAT